MLGLRFAMFDALFGAKPTNTQLEWGRTQAMSGLKARRATHFVVTYRLQAAVPTRAHESKGGKRSAVFVATP
jgi:hypothetical protein